MRVQHTGAAVLLTGATGFTGGHVAQELTRRAIPFDALVRPSSDRTSLQQAGVRMRVGDIGDVETMVETLQHYRVLINVASLGFGSGPRLVEASEKAGIERAVFVSTTAIFTHLDAQSKSVRLAAEDAIRASNLAYTILRPTMIYGSPGDRNMTRLLHWIARYRFVPVFGSGTSLQQPVHVGDVAWAIAEASQTAAASRREYDISGAAPLAYLDVVREAASALGVRCRLLRVPMRPSLSLLRLARKLGVRTPVSDEQLQRLDEDKAFSHEAATRDFGYSPRTFRDGIRAQAAMLGLST